MRKVILLLFGLLIVIEGQQTGARYLIITHDNFYDAVKPLATWKARKGMKSKLVKFSEIGTDSIAIRNYIANAYNTWDIQPKYLLLVGAPNHIPFPRVNDIFSDNYYTNIEGDIHNEILSGRLTVHDTIEAQTVIKKILQYERKPYTEDSLWFKKACLIVKLDYDPDDSIYWSDAKYAAGLMATAGFVEIDTFVDSLGHNADSIINAVNNGRSIVMFRGSAFNHWPDPFNVDPDLLQNSAKLPIVLSITCQTIGTGSSPAQVERWFLTGSPTNLKGASGYFATTTMISGQAYLRSAVAKGFHFALFNNDQKTLGSACEGGRNRVYTMYPYQGGLNEYLGYTTIGDPEMNLWTGTPCSLICNHPLNIPIGNVNFTVNVARASSSSPVSSALVCVIGNLDTTVYQVDTTDIYGNAYFNINPYFPGDTIYVTVTGHNLQPYEGKIVTDISSVYIAYLKSIIDDSLGGNNDGMVNPGEDINLPLWVKNYGYNSGIGVTAVIHTSDGYTTITDSSKTFGDILAEDSAFTGNDGYNFTIVGDCPDEHDIAFDLVCRDIYDSVWVSHFHQSVHAAELIFQEIEISGGNGNSTFEPGETVTVIVTIRNQGSASIDSITAFLGSYSPYVGIIDSIGFFNFLAPDSSTNNGENPFTVYSDSNTPPGTVVDLHMRLSSGYYLDTIQFSLPVGKKDYYLWNPDPTPASGENMDSILTILGYSGDYGTDLISDLSPFDAIFVCVGVFPNNYVIVDDSPEAITLSDFTSNGGKIYLEGGDVWYFDPLGNGYDFCTLFGIDASDDGSGDISPIAGVTGTFTVGMTFTDYSGENNYIDHIDPIDSGFLVFYDTDNTYNCGVASDPGGYRSVGTSFELGLLDDGSLPSTRAVLLDSIMQFFKNTPGIAERSVLTCINHLDFSAYPNPTNHLLKIELNSPHPCKITLKLFDCVGRLVKTIYDGRVNTGTNEFLVTLRELAAGIYFVRTEAEVYTKTTKIILLN
jgi:hypothetical protein